MDGKSGQKQIRCGVNDWQNQNQRANAGTAFVALRRANFWHQHAFLWQSFALPCRLFNLVVNVLLPFQSLACFAGIKIKIIPHRLFF